MRPQHPAAGTDEWRDQIAREIGEQPLARQDECTGEDGGEEGDKDATDEMAVRAARARTRSRPRASTSFRAVE